MTLFATPCGRPNCPQSPLVPTVFPNSIGPTDAFIQQQFPHFIPKTHVDGDENFQLDAIQADNSPKNFRISTNKKHVEKSSNDFHHPDTRYHLLIQAPGLRHDVIEVSLDKGVLRVTADATCKPEILITSFVEDVLYNLIHPRNLDYTFKVHPDMKLVSVEYDCGCILIKCIIPYSTATIMVAKRPEKKA